MPRVKIKNSHILVGEFISNSYRAGAGLFP